MQFGAIHITICPHVTFFFFAFIISFQIPINHMLSELSQSKNGRKTRICSLLAVPHSSLQPYFGICLPQAPDSTMALSMYIERR